MNVSTNTRQVVKAHQQVCRAEIWMADISGVEGAVQSGQRPVIVLSNDMGNKFGPTVIVAPLTTKKTKKRIPTHVSISAKSSGLIEDSIALLEQIRVIDQWCLMYKIGEADYETMERVNYALLISVGLSSEFNKGIIKKEEYVNVI